MICKFVEIKRATILLFYGTTQHDLASGSND